MQERSLRSRNSTVWPTARFRCTRSPETRLSTRDRLYFPFILPLSVRLFRRASLEFEIRVAWNKDEQHFLFKRDGYNLIFDEDFFFLPPHWTRAGNERERIWGISMGRGGQVRSRRDEIENVFRTITTGEEGREERERERAIRTFDNGRGITVEKQSELRRR